MKYKMWFLYGHKDECDHDEDYYKDEAASAVEEAVAESDGLSSADVDVYGAPAAGREMQVEIHLGVDLGDDLDGHDGRSELRQALSGTAIDHVSGPALR